MRWGEGKASVADWGELRIAGGEQGPAFDVSNCMVDVMEGEGWSGLGI